MQKIHIDGNTQKKVQMFYFSNLCFMFFSEPMELVKSVLVEEVLSVVCRGLAVTGLSLGHSPTLEHQALLILLPSIHCSVLSVLKALIAM